MASINPVVEVTPDQTSDNRGVDSQGRRDFLRLGALAGGVAVATYTAHRLDLFSTVLAHTYEDEQELGVTICEEPDVIKRIKVRYSDVWYDQTILENYPNNEFLAAANLLVMTDPNMTAIKGDRNFGHAVLIDDRDGMSIMAPWHVLESVIEYSEHHDAAAYLGKSIYIDLPHLGLLTVDLKKLNKLVSKKSDTEEGWLKVKLPVDIVRLLQKPSNKNLLAPLKFVSPESQERIVETAILSQGATEIIPFNTPRRVPMLHDPSGVLTYFESDHPPFIRSGYSGKGILVMENGRPTGEIYGVLIETIMSGKCGGVDFSGENQQCGNDAYVKPFRTDQYRETAVVFDFKPFDWVVVGKENVCVNNPNILAAPTFYFDKNQVAHYTYYETYENDGLTCESPGVVSGTTGWYMHLVWQPV